MTHVAHDPRFHEVVDVEAPAEPVLTGLGITEGTVWHPREQHLVFSDLSSSTVYRWTQRDGAAVLRRPSNITNGNTLDRQGRVLSCEHATSCVSRIEADGRFVRVLATHWQGQAFNSPNDIVCDRQGRIWFTDPLFGRTSPRVGVLRPQELGFQGVFRIETDGRVTRIADDFAEPNGLCFTPDERTLLVNDHGRGHIRRYAVDGDGTVSGGDVFAAIPMDDTGKPDGMKVDVDGRVYCTGAGGIHVLAPDGKALGLLRMPDKTRNFCFGGEDGRTLFLAVHGGIWRLRVKVAGVLPGLD